MYSASKEAALQAREVLAAARFASTRGSFGKAASHFTERALCIRFCHSAVVKHALNNNTHKEAEAVVVRTLKKRNMKKKAKQLKSHMIHNLRLKSLKS